MNKKQLISLWVGIIIIVLMGLFPPWFFTGFDRGGALGPRESSSYKFLIPPPKRRGVEGFIDLGLLSVQWIIVAAVTTGLVVTFKDIKQKDEQNK